jgi:hypothetical protein
MEESFPVVDASGDLQGPLPDAAEFGALHLLN